MRVELGRGALIAKIELIIIGPCSCHEVLVFSRVCVRTQINRFAVNPASLWKPSFHRVGNGGSGEATD